MYVAALIHTEGVLLFNKYVVLELAYSDDLGVTRHFLIKSPMSYTKAKKHHNHLKKSLEVIMCCSDYFKNHKVYKFFEIMQFLKARYTLLQRYHLGKSIHFGYKGKSFQQDILKKCHIPNVNIECFGVPSIQTLMINYPFVRKDCIYHKKPFNKCAEHILRLINIYLHFKHTTCFSHC